MTQITRLFPGNPELDAALDRAPQADWGMVPASPQTPAHPTPHLLRADQPPALASGSTTVGELHSPLRLARLIVSLETAASIPERVRTMPGVAVLRDHFEMQSCLNGLLRGLVKE